MGCDIHFYVERINSKNKWSSVSEKFYISRSYTLFGVLAGVRSDLFEPFIEPRGIPNDVSSKIKREFKSWSGDAHTPSYIFLNELLDFKEKKINLDCWLDIKNYKLYQKTNEILNLGSLFEPYNGVEISEEDMIRRIKLITFAEETNYFTKIKSDVSTKIISKDFWDVTVENMKKLHKDPTKVRCVFWFDN